MEIAIIVWLLCGIASANIASNKGRSSGKGFILGFVLGPLGVLIAFTLASNAKGIEQKAVSEGTGRKCPYCAELVKLEAIKCRHCGSDISAQSAG
ncbi:zinc ribbon domain-containing protein [Blastomonas sp. CCH1-A6]|jgi:uncharacterized membrane protein YeaQ/YmgE (transglycosylase-associated protein family)|uniref:zinc ribbon domain-containing protein n=1 Tax=Blastomonas sp. CCH1-A6 TaxID=1768762 RepID=UPI0009E9517E